MAADLQTIIGSVGGIFQQVSAAGILTSAAEQQAQTINIGGQIAASGALLTASGFRQSADAVRQATEFNLDVDRINTQRRLKSVSRQFQRTVGRQITQQAASGFAITSKTFLQTRNETADVFGRAILNLKVDAENTRRAKLFESAVKQTNLENQARAAEFRASAERVMASNRAAAAAFQGDIASFKTTQSIIKSVPTLLGQLL